MNIQWTGMEALEERTLLSAGPFHFQDDGGEKYSVNLRGPGTMIVVQDDADQDGRGPLVSIDLINTTVKSKLIIKGRTTVDEITGDPVRKLKAKKLTVHGAGINLGGSVEDKMKIILGTLAAGSDITYAGTLQKLKLGEVESGSTIEAARGGKVIVKNTFSGDLILTDAVANKSLNQLKAGKLIGAEVRVPGSIGKVKAKQAVDSNIFAGIDPAQNDLPDDAGDFINKDALIGKIKITGGPKNDPWIDNTNIAAWKVGKYRVGHAESDNEGEDFGLATNHAGLFRYESRDVSVKLRNAENSDVIFRDGDLTLRFFEEVV